MSEVVGPWPCNDMAVDSNGSAYVGGFGYDVFSGTPMVGTHLTLVTPDGKVRAVGDEVVFPNGIVIAPDGITPDDTPLIVAETMSERLVAFTITDDGSLVNTPRLRAGRHRVPTASASTKRAAVLVAHPCASARSACYPRRRGDRPRRGFPAATCPRACSVAPTAAPCSRAPAPLMTESGNGADTVGQTREPGQRRHDVPGAGVREPNTPRWSPRCLAVRATAGPALRQHKSSPAWAPR